MTQPRSNKFQLYCSCATCKLPITTQNIKSHYQKYHIQKEPKSICPCCDAPIFDNKIYCSRSCAAKITNKKKDYSKFKPGPAKGFTPSVAPHNKRNYTPVAPCVICSKLHKAGTQTCSIICKKKLLSIRTNQRIEAGWNPQDHRSRSKPSFLEKSFEHWLITIKYSNYVKNKTFRCGKKLYFGDFYFPRLQLLIELDGRQHKDNADYDTERDYLIFKFHKVSTIRITYDEYMSKCRLPEIYNLISGASAESQTPYA